MNNICQFLDWDSNHFKIKIAKVSLLNLKISQYKIVDQWCIKNKIKCLYYLKEKNNNPKSSIEADNNFKFVDARVVYTLKIKKGLEQGIKSNNFIYTKFLKQTNPILYKISDENIKDTRFYNDENFNIFLVKNMYRKWIDKVVNGSNSYTIIAKENNQIIGFISFTFLNKYLNQIDLVATDKTKKSIGVASLLMTDCIKFCRKKNIKHINVATQLSNYPAKMFYEKFGFIKAFEGEWYHKWYNSNDNTI